MSGLAIVAVGYDRPDSMASLLNSIGRIVTDQNIELVISIDKGTRQKEVIAVAEKFEWHFGRKRIRVFDERQGLRKHIIQCGDLTKEYAAVVVLEDDLIVSPFCISYVEQAIDYYGDSERIAGISLYKHLFHPGASRPFEAAHNGYDAYFMQFAQSWGQCWTSSMWAGFKEWYCKHENMDLTEGHILPDYICSWNEHSWLKYYMRYIVESDKYFVYPSVSLSSNASDAGEHCSVSMNDYQVPMLSGEMLYRFPDVDHAVKYDVFFERQGINTDCFDSLRGNKVIDLYGTRSYYVDADYLITTNELPYQVVRECALKLRPIEANILSPSEGKGIFVYDMRISGDKPSGNESLVTRYDIRGANWKKMLKFGFSGLLDAVKRKLRRS